MSEMLQILFTVNTSCSVKQGYKATFQLMAGVPLWLGGSTLNQGRRCRSIKKPDMEGYLPITPPFLVLHTMTQFCEQLCLLLGPLSNGIYWQWCHSLSQMYLIWQTFMLTTHYLKSSPVLSVDALVDIHSRSHSFPLIHPREVLLAGHWVTAHPLISCGIILPSLPLACMEWCWYICPVHDGHLYTRECQPLTWWEEASFGGGCMTICIGPSLCRRECLSWSDAPPHMFPLPTYP